MIKTRPEAGATEALGTDEHLGFSPRDRTIWYNTGQLLINILNHNEWRREKTDLVYQEFLTYLKTLHIFSCVQTEQQKQRKRI